MPYDVATLEKLTHAHEDEMRVIWPGITESQLIDDHATYDLHLIAHLDDQLVGWAAIRFAQARMTADLVVSHGSESISHTVFLIDALRVVSDDATSIEWWTRGHCAEIAQRVAAINGLPHHRKIIRMERAGKPVDCGIKVRSFRADDAEELVRVNNAAFVDHPDQFDLTVEKFNRELARRHASNHDILLTHVNSKLAAFMWTMPRDANEGELHVLAVAPEFQGRGIGGRMIDAGVDHLMRSYGIKKTSLYVDSANEPAIAMYEKHGFVDVDAPLISYLA